MKDGVEVNGTFDVQAFYTALAAILSKRENVRISVTVTRKDQPDETERAAS